MQLFASWGADLIEVDACNGAVDRADLQKPDTPGGRAMASTGNPGWGTEGWHTDVTFTPISVTTSTSNGALLATHASRIHGAHAK